MDDLQNQKAFRTFQLKSCLLRKDFDFHRNSRPTVPMYADRRELLGFRNFFSSLIIIGHFLLPIITEFPLNCNTGSPFFRHRSNCRAAKFRQVSTLQIPSFFLSQEAERRTITAFSRRHYIQKIQKNTAKRPSVRSSPCRFKQRSFCRRF